ncbi:putative phage abortive infection protein (plasmid) [Enterococcus casseliflavus]|uniref:putative phage abortive infection protein n=1 Tax=Enterococcus casseliflavus TaxID=37734 RepID=UPI003D198BAC
MENYLIKVLVTSNIVLIALIVFFINKKIKDTLMFILTYVVSMVPIIIITYLWMLKLYDSSVSSAIISYKDLISPTVTTIGLIITVNISYMTIRFNQKKQEIDLIYSLIKDQKSLVTDEIIKVVSIIEERCNSELTTANIAYIRTVNFIKKNKENIFLENEINDENVVNTIKLLKKKAKYISDRDIELLVLHNWQDYIEVLNKSQFLKRKLAKANIEKSANIRKIDKPHYEILGKFLFGNGTISGFMMGKKAELTYRTLDKNITYEEAVDIINNIYRVNYYKLGHLFKHFHRIIRLILEGVVSKDKKVQKDLIGILRAQFSEEILLLLYYNATYTYRGFGLGILMQGTGFWGDAYDFQSFKKKQNTIEEYQEITHISSSKFYLPHIDNKIIKEIYGSGRLVKVPKKKRKETEKKKFINKVNALQNNDL